MFKVTVTGPDEEKNKQLADCIIKSTQVEIVPSTITNVEQLFEEAKKIKAEKEEKEKKEFFTTEVSNKELVLIKKWITGVLRYRRSGFMNIWNIKCTKCKTKMAQYVIPPEYVTEEEVMDYAKMYLKCGCTSRMKQMYANAFKEDNWKVKEYHVN